jgi:uncharacterized protein (TIGR02594 family)
MSDEAQAPWLRVARGELGVRNFPAGTNVAGHDDKVDWCSSFVDWVLARAGLRGTGSALARSWLAWGDALDEPRPGCVAVLWREDPQSWKGHVGFFIREEDDQVVLLGGNQLEAVREHRYPRAQVLAWRWPSAASAPT